MGFLVCFVNKYNRRLMEDKLVTLAILTYTKAQIIKAMEQGARTLNDIRKMTGACTLHRCKELSPKGT